MTECTNKTDPSFLVIAPAVREDNKPLDAAPEILCLPLRLLWFVFWSAPVLVIVGAWLKWGFK